MSDLAAYGPLFALFLLICASVWLGTLAQRAVQRGSFVKGYFLGNRGLGAWALALTATVQSGGTFMGYPSLIYSHGWIVALWIAGYMVVPLSGFGVLGKRMAQLSRRTGAITVPDLFRERFGSPAVGAVALAFILFFMTFMMVAQFKAGAVIMKNAWPTAGSLALAEDATTEFDRAYYIGLSVFALTVIGYTLIGGFLAAVWTDLFQSVMMFVGVVLLLGFTLHAAGGLSSPAQTIENATRAAVANTGPGYAFGPGYSKGDSQFLPLGLAISFFFVWVYSGIGSPAGTVRIMACKDTATIRRSIFLLAAYNSFIYLPLVIICVCGRALIPELTDTDEIVPRLALKATAGLWGGWGGALFAGLILSAPFGAVMATVSSYLVVIASGLVRDLYQRFLRPDATQTEIRRLSYAVMIVVGAIAVAANIRPVAYLQSIVVFSGTGAAATFVMPALMTAYWRRGTAAGAIAAMLAGAGACFSLYFTGFVLTSSFTAYYLLGLHPLLWGLAASVVAGLAVSLMTKGPEPALVSRLFDAQPAEQPA